MHACTVTASKGSSEIEVVVVGHSAAAVPEVVEREAARIAAGKVEGPLQVLAEDQRWLLVAPKPQEWLEAGEAWRQLGAQIVAALRAAGLRKATVHVGGDEAEVQALVEGAILGDYRFTDCRSGDAAKRKTVSLRIPGSKRAVAAGSEVAESQNIARDFGDQPGNALNPKTYLKRARKALDGLGLEIRTIEGVSALEKAGFPGLVMVGRAGSAPPALLEIRYVPKKKPKSKTRLALVGKGITFDSGGISLKPGAGMGEMKLDMGGSAAVLGAIHLIARQKPAVPVTAYIALAENMPDSNAFRPGDIYRARNGKWINVDNTDAEGRLVLSDVLTYACEQGATHVVDAATLTGAALVGLGMGLAAVMSRHDDWAQQVRSAGAAVGEGFWHLPLYGEYRALLDHPHADLNNIGGRTAGTITAGIFLSEFVDPTVRWAHCDIAGPAMRFDGWRYYAKGSTGFAARTFARLAQEL